MPPSCSSSTASCPTPRWLLLTSLLVADELSDAYEEIKRLKAQAQADLDRWAEEEAAQALDRVTSRLEQLAATLESA